jgi:hypothetical protein
MYLEKNSYEYLTYNIWTITIIAQDALCLRGTHNLYISSSLCKLNESECISSILYFRRLRHKSSKYDVSICNVGQKSFLYKWSKHFNRPFDKRYIVELNILHFPKTCFLYCNADILTKSKAIVFNPFAFIEAFIWIFTL